MALHGLVHALALQGEGAGVVVLLAVYQQQWALDLISEPVANNKINNELTFHSTLLGF
jgi:hypothetical protein